MEELELESSGPLLITPEGHARLTAELQRLTVEKRKEIAERIRDSRDHGEYSEDNSELDEVKIEQAIVENRISELKSILSEAAILTDEDISTDMVGVGSLVQVEDKEHDLDFSVRIVAAVEANPDEDLISEESPFGLALARRKVGETVAFDAPAGRITYTIKAISK
jgi:transcription elongation factor GreA